MTAVAMFCGECGVEFSMPQGLYNARQKDGATFYCPNGHARCYRPTELEKRIAALEKDVVRRDRWLENNADALREAYGVQEDLIARIRECPGGCGWRSRRQVPRNAEHMQRGLERVRLDIAEHLVREHGARATVQRALEAAS